MIIIQTHRRTHKQITPSGTQQHAAVPVGLGWNKGETAEV